MIRPPLRRAVPGRLAALLAAAALLGPAASAVAGAPTKAEQVKAERARARRLTRKSHLHRAMKEAKGKGMSPCDALAKAAVAAAKDIVLRGVDPGYLQAITTLETARRVATRHHAARKGAKLSRAQWSQVGGSTCQSELDDLKAEARKLEKTAPQAGAASQACQALDRKLTTSCYAGLRLGQVSEACHRLSSVASMGLPGDQMCSIGASMIP